MKKNKVIVIGGGAAGLVAAAEASKNGAEVLLLEKMKRSARTARKLCITGKGRCNITNTADLRTFITHFGKKGRFLRQAFHQYFTPDTIDFFEKQGVKLVFERGGRIFPASGKAPDVANALIQFAKENSVVIKTSSPVKKLLIEDNKITGVEVNGEKISADHVILALGGASYPLTGSTGDGYKLAKSAGHNIIPIRPALVPLITKENCAGKMNGLNLRNIGVTLFVDGKKIRSEFGELVFADFGITGPITLTLSKEVIDILYDNKQQQYESVKQYSSDTQRLEAKEKKLLAINPSCKIEISIDLKPALDEKKLNNRLIRDFTKRSTEQFSSVLRGLMAKEMVPVCINATKISPKKLVNQISSQERKKLLHWLKDFRLEIIGHRPIAEAIVTSGGVDTKEINPKTMESKICKNLFIVGELLDLDADTGGYNLQAAFSTGWVAGNSVSSDQ